ncbi:hypothetical protein ACFSTE_08115 [Aquimarina hainanensis]|uniref:Lipoprotein n=1 Tax=Aquimarina hainanensis TaxID=1578017 RepID=A0ABW5N591_9FLAO|nr:hypothetical protein [Aquimarina sp. TRL1]QKX05207.1 hypothetical protein HN014_09820 [Aquimarina sp. TRL1]
MPIKKSNSKSIGYSSYLRVVTAVLISIVIIGCQTEEDTLEIQNKEISQDSSTIAEKLKDGTYLPVFTSSNTENQSSEKSTTAPIKQPLTRAIVDKLWNTKSTRKRQQLLRLFTSDDGYEPDGISFNKTEGVDWWGYTDDESDYLPIPSVSHRLGLKAYTQINPPTLKLESRSSLNDIGNHRVAYLINKTDQILSAKLDQYQETQSKITVTNEYTQEFTVGAEASFTTGIKMIAEGKIKVTASAKIGFKQIRGKEETFISRNGLEVRGISVQPRSVLKVTYIELKQTAKWSFESGVSMNGMVGLNYGHPVRNNNSSTAHYFWGLPASRITDGFIENNKGYIETEGYMLATQIDVISYDEFNAEDAIGKIIDLSKQ